MPAHRRRVGRLALPESKTGALDFRVPGDGFGLPSERGALPQSALLCNGAVLIARGSIRHSVGLPSRAHAAGDFPDHHSRRGCFFLFGRGTAWQISEKSLRREWNYW